jgi:hypothetical protein
LKFISMTKGCVSQAWRATRGGKEELHLRVGGMERATGEHLTWVNMRLNVGDNVTVRIVETDSID